MPLTYSSAMLSIVILKSESEQVANVGQLKMHDCYIGTSLTLQG